MTTAMAHVAIAARLRIPAGKVVSLVSFTTASSVGRSSVFVPKLFTAATAAGPDASSCPVILPGWDIGQRAW